MIEQSIIHDTFAAHARLILSHIYDRNICEFHEDLRRLDEIECRLSARYGPALVKLARRKSGIDTIQTPWNTAPKVQRSVLRLHTQLSGRLSVQPNASPTPAE